MGKALQSPLWKWERERKRVKGGKKKKKEKGSKRKVGKGWGEVEKIGQKEKGGKKIIIICQIIK